MATFSKQRFSEAGNGLPILLSQTATAGNLIHTAHASAQDEIWLYVTNWHTAAVVVTIEFGGVAQKDLIIQTIAVKPSGLVLVVPGIPVTGSVAIRAFAATTNVITVSGYVNRIA